MRFKINSLEELEVIGIDINNDEHKEVIELITEYWNDNIDIYLNDGEVYGLYNVTTEGGLWLGYLAESEEYGEVELYESEEEWEEALFFKMLRRAKK